MPPVSPTNHPNHHHYHLPTVVGVLEAHSFQTDAAGSLEAVGVVSKGGSQQNSWHILGDRLIPKQLLWVDRGIFHVGPTKGLTFSRGPKGFQTSHRVEWWNDFGDSPWRYPCENSTKKHPEKHPLPPKLRFGIWLDPKNISVKQRLVFGCLGYSKNYISSLKLAASLLLKSQWSKGENLFLGWPICKRQAVCFSICMYVNNLTYSTLSPGKPW